MSGKKTVPHALGLLNDVTRKDSYLIPRIDETLDYGSLVVVQLARPACSVVSQLSREQLRAAQESYPILSRVLAWVQACARPDYAASTDSSPELKAFLVGEPEFSRRLIVPPLGASERAGGILQLLVPRQLRERVLGLVHGRTGTGHTNLFPGKL